MKGFVATLTYIKKVNEVPEEILPYIRFKAELEKREIKGDETVAIFNIVSTTSYVPVFLDDAKTLKEIEEEVEKSGHAKMNHESRAAVENFLRYG
jgi:hypothetical protein